ncbi:hypothetical protein LXL04_020976 [Taraxacum kok-saghyz]
MNEDQKKRISRSNNRSLDLGDNPPCAVPRAHSLPETESKLWSLIRSKFFCVQVDRDEQKLQVPELRTGTATELAVPELELPQASPVPILNIRELPSSIPVPILIIYGTTICRTVPVPTVPSSFEQSSSKNQGIGVGSSNSSSKNQGTGSSRSISILAYAHPYKWILDFSIFCPENNPERYWASRGETPKIEHRTQLSILDRCFMNAMSPKSHVIMPCHKKLTCIRTTSVGNRVDRLNDKLGPERNKKVAIFRVDNLGPEKNKTLAILRVHKADMDNLIYMTIVIREPNETLENKPNKEPFES